MVCQMFFFIVSGAEGLVHISTSAKLQIFSGTDKHRTSIGLASELERIYAIFVYILTKIAGLHNNFI